MTMTSPGCHAPGRAAQLQRGENQAFSLLYCNYFQILVFKALVAFQVTAFNAYFLN